MEQLERDTTLPVAVVGGGVIGLAAAWWLNRLGAKVCLLEAGAVGRGVSWDAAGMLAPLHELEYTEQELLAAGRQSRSLYGDWARELGEIGYAEEGALEVALSADDLPELQRRYRFMQQQGLEAEWLSGPQLHNREPALAQRIQAGIWAPTDAQVDNRLLVQVLQANLEQAGVKLLEHTTVLAAELTAEGLELALSSQAGSNMLQARAVVVATGLGPQVQAATGACAPGRLLAPPLPLYPVKGQMLSLTPLSDYTLPQTVVRIRSRTLGNGYVAPKQDRLVVGATAEEKGPDSNVTAGGLLDVLRRAYAALPGIYELPVQETWAGLRPATLSRQPVLAETVGGRVLHVNGLYRHGILLAPLVGRAAARWALGAPLDPSVLPFFQPAASFPASTSSAASSTPLA